MITKLEIIKLICREASIVRKKANRVSLSKNELYKIYTYISANKHRQQ